MWNWIVVINSGLYRKMERKEKLEVGNNKKKASVTRKTVNQKATMGLVGENK